jgi:hypothetical protein
MLGLVRTDAAAVVHLDPFVVFGVLLDEDFGGICQLRLR